MDEDDHEYAAYLTYLQASTKSPKQTSPTMVPENKEATYEDLYRMVACLIAKAVIDKVTLPVHFDHLFLAGLLARDTAYTEK